MVHHCHFLSYKQQLHELQLHNDDEEMLSELSDASEPPPRQSMKGTVRWTPKKFFSWYYYTSGPAKATGTK